jgi:hypothetical protein
MGLQLYLLPLFRIPKTHRSFRHPHLSNNEISILSVLTCEGEETGYGEGGEDCEVA